MRIAPRSYNVPVFFSLLVPIAAASACDDSELPPFPDKKATSSVAGMGHGGAATAGAGTAALSGGVAGGPGGGAAPRSLFNEAGSMAIAAGGNALGGSAQEPSAAGTGGDLPLGVGGAENASGGSSASADGGADAFGGIAGSNGGVIGTAGSAAAGAAGVPTAGNGGITLGQGGTATGGVATGGVATGGVATGGVATGGVATGGVATGGVTTGGVATGGVATGGVATGGVATGGVATGGVATGGVATGGVATGGVATGGAPNCDSTPSSRACDGVCVDISSDPDNCRACGHACGYGSTCVAGQCQPVLVYRPTATITAFEVDDKNIVFSPTGIQSCSAAGCAISPDTISSYSPGAERFLANGYALVQIPNVGATGRYTGYGLCPTTGCTTSNMIGFGETNQQVSIYTLRASAHNFYKSMKTPVSTGLSYCGAPSGSGCATSGGVSGFTTSSIVVSDGAIFFNASISGTEATLYACGVADLSSCTPTAINLPNTLMPVTRVMAAYADDLYFYQPGGAPPNTIPTLRKCSRTGCVGTMGTLLGQLSSDIEAMEVDASGVYWISGSSIQMCPLSGCVGAPLIVAASIGAPTMLRLNTRFVYWVNPGNNAIYRVAKPAL